MSRLVLSNGRRLKVGLVFEHPDDDNIALTASPEARAAVAEGMLKGEMTPEAMDLEMGMAVTAMAQLTITTKAGVAETSVYMTKGELIRHAYECRAIIKSMDRAAQMADGEWKGYREEIRRRT